MKTVLFNLDALEQATDTKGETWKLSQMLDSHLHHLERLGQDDFWDQKFRVTTASKWAEKLDLKFAVGDPDGKELKWTPDNLRKIRGKVPLGQFKDDIGVNNKMTISKVENKRSAGSVQLAHKIGLKKGVKFIIDKNTAKKFK